ncbi:MAG: hypothetical protein ABJ205_03290 [Erythrobacter sp.]
MACGGSGQGAPNYVTCWNCHGAGWIEDTSPAPTYNRKSATKKSNSAKSGQAGDDYKWSLGNYAVFAIVYLGVLGYLNQETEWEGLFLFLGPIVPAVLAGRYWKGLLLVGVVLFGFYIWSQNS